MQKFQKHRDFAKLHTIEPLEKTLKVVHMDVEEKFRSERSCCLFLYEV